MNYLHIQKDLAYYKSLSNYTGTRVAAVLYDIDGQKLVGDYCYDYGNGSTNKYVAHAEQRVITQAGLLDLLHPACTIAITSPPCLECAKLILSTRIGEVIVFGRFLTNWKESQLEAINLLQENNVIYTKAL